MATLMWISHAECPLKASELCHALSVEIGSPNLDYYNVPSIGLLLACCQGLITIDKETSTVRLTHYTLQEYFRAHPELFGLAHSTMAETCLSYLNSDQVKALSARPDIGPGNSDLQSTPFLKYSSLYWGMHAKKELSDCSKLLALSLFGDYSNHISIKILLKEVEPYHSCTHSDTIPPFSGLHCASLFGIAEIVAVLVEVKSCDINQEDCVCNTPLVWAARNGHERVVEILLGQDDSSPDKRGKLDRTPLSFAAGNGHEGVLKMLLGRDDVNPDRSDWDFQTPLSYAAQKGLEGVVKILLQRDDVNPNERDGNGETPLSHAAERGHEGVVKVLLQRSDVDPDTSGMGGQTPLSYAAMMGHEGVVKTLLQRDDVSPSAPDWEGDTPLSLATRMGHERVVKMLLQRDGVNPSAPDGEGGTPLFLATLSGHPFRPPGGGMMGCSNGTTTTPTSREG